MKKNNIIKWVLLLALILTITAFTTFNLNLEEISAQEQKDQIQIWELDNVEKSQQGPSEGNKSPGFSYINDEDEKINLSDLEGKVVFLNFWASWCPPCKKEMPAIQNIFEKYNYNEEEIKVISINIQEQHNQIQSFMSSNNLSFPVIKDPGTLAQNYGVRGIPSSFFLDKEGIIRVIHTGSMTEKMIDDALQEAQK